MHTTEDVMPCLCYILCSQKWFCTSSFFFVDRFLETSGSIMVRWFSGLFSVYAIAENWDHFLCERQCVCNDICWSLHFLYFLYIIQLQPVLVGKMLPNRKQIISGCIQPYLISLWHPDNNDVFFLPTYFLRSDRRIPKRPYSWEEAVRVLSYLYENNLVHILWKIVNSFLRWIAI